MLYVAIDYFTKWVEVKAVEKPNSKATEKFFYHDVVCRFGIPRILVTDNGPQFASAEFGRFCDGLSIEHRFASVAHPQANEQVEVTNIILLQSLKKRLGETGKNWVEALPSVLWAYRTTPRTATGESPFSLTFGAEAVIPLEIGLPNFRTENYDEQGNSELLRNTLDLALRKAKSKVAVLSGLENSKWVILDGMVW
ncbi:uncharacterized protein LOC143869785 [Tasmannia lanceolata]|uniref:uncharacterized protein LOC143869785 n=1 Tax=Tasmannia lanceolata TaxID=3420 RepID=UPI0040641902